MARPTTFNGKHMSYYESLHWCGCDGCAQEIEERAKSKPPLKPDFVAYLRAEYPKTAHLLTTPSDKVGGE